jgi:hypothetical protein
MKRYWLGIVVTMIFLTGVIYASNLTKKDSAIMKGEENLLIALNSDNYGLKTSRPDFR